MGEEPVSVVADKAGGRAAHVGGRPSLRQPRAPAIKAFQEAATSVGGKDPIGRLAVGEGSQNVSGRRGEAVINGGLSICIFPLI